jgi:hypothetical protein
MAAPFMEQEDTVMINAIPASQRLSDALCFLAIGQAT